jgi:hypothetical protein
MLRKDDNFFGNLMPFMESQGVNGIKAFLLCI